MYKVNVEYRHQYKNGRRILNPKFKREVTHWKRKEDKGILKGAKGYKQHLIEVYGKSNVRNFKIIKFKGAKRL